MKMNTTAMKAAMVTTPRTKARVASASDPYSLAMDASSSLSGESLDVGDDVQHRLIVGERHRHRTHQHPGGVLRVGAAHARLELLERGELVPVAPAREWRRVERLVALPIHPVTGDAEHVLLLARLRTATREG